MRQSMRQRSFLAAGQADQAFGSFRNFRDENMALALWRLQFHFRDEAAKILVSQAGGNQQRITPSVRGSNFRANVGVDGKFFRG